MRPAAFVYRGSCTFIQSQNKVNDSVLNGGNMVHFARILPMKIARLLLAILCACTFAPSARAQTIADTFTGGSASQLWQVYGGACLTAGDGSGTIPACAVGSQGGLAEVTPDVSGNGVLRLTQALTNQAGGIISASSFASNSGFSITFTAYSYGGTGADGISFFLLDASQSLPSSLGGLGGGIGYSGITGGYLGLGIDEFGNFSNPGCVTTPACSGGPGRRPNAIAVRGSTANANPYIAGVTPGFALWDNVSTRAAATARTYTITLSSSGILTVYIDGTIYITGFDAFAGAGTLPARLRFGFAASTGGSTNIHAIRSVSVTTTFSSQVSAAKTATLISDPFNGTTNPKYIPGATVRYCIQVTNASGSLAATSPVVTDPLASVPVTFVPGSIRLNGTVTGGTCNWNGSAGGTFALNTVSGTLASLAAGATSTLYFDATVK